MSYLFLVKASANEFSEMVLKPLEIGHFLRNVGLRTVGTDNACIGICINLTELLLFKIGFRTYCHMP